MTDQTAHDHHRIYRFGGFELDAARQRLQLQGETLKVDPKPLALLLFLLRHRERAVPRQEALEAIWPGVTVSDAAFSSALRDLRRALADDGSRQEWIRTIRGVGLRFVAPVIETVHEQSPDVFVGREETLARMRAAFASAEASRGRLVLLYGEAGIGKTRTSHEFLAWVRGRGVEPWATSCPDSDGLPAYWSWRELARALSPDDPAESGRAGLERAIAEAESAGPGDNARSARFLAADGIGSAVAECVRGKTRVLFFDDLHWADAPSLEAFERLAGRVRDQRVLVVGTYRDTDLDGAASALLARVIRSQPDAAAELMPLTRAEAEELLRRTLARQPEQEAAEILWRRSGGNPLLLRELASVQEADPERRLPSGLREVIRARLDGLSTECRGFVDAASVLGTRFALELLAIVAELSLPACRDLGAEARAARILVPDAEAGRMQFAHGLLRDVAYEDLAPARRVELHARAARALEPQLAVHGVSTSEVAHHFFEAAQAGLAREAYDTSRRAGRDAARALAHEEASRWYERALSLHEEAGADEAERLGLLLDLGDARALGGSPEPARDGYREALRLADRLGDAEAFGRAALGVSIGEVVGVPVPEHLTALRGALDRNPAPSALRARLLGRLGYCNWFGEPRDLARRTMHEAIELAREVGDADTLYGILARAHWVEVGPARTSERLAITGELAKLAQRVNDPVLVATSRVATVWDALATGDLVTVEREIAAAEREAREFELPLVAWWARTLAASRAFLAGRLADAEAAAQTAAEAGRQSSDAIWHEPTYAIVIEKIRFHQDRLAEIEPVARMIAERLPEHRAWGLLVRYCEAARGEKEAAALELRRHVDSEFAELRDDVNWYNLAHFLVLICEAVGSPTAARALYALLEPVADEGHVVAPGWLYLGSFHRWLGVLSGIAGEWETSEEHFRAGLERDRKMGALLCEAEGLVQWAALRVARGAPEAAQALLDEGLALADSLGASRTAARARGLIEAAR